MRYFLGEVLSGITLLSLISTVTGHFVEEATKVHQWVVSVEGGESVAKEVAQTLGLTYKDKVGDLDYYIIEGQWPYSQKVSLYSHPIKKREAHVKSKSWVAEISDKLSQFNAIKYSQRQIPKKRVKRDSGSLQFNDPSWSKSWYLIKGAVGGYDMNVRAAWEAGYTGTGIVVSILDDGIERDHPDLAPNYDPMASRDINGDDDDPSPRYDSVNTNRHGTRCAGQVAAVANNNVCTVGVAFNAKIGGVRMLDGGITDSVEAASLSLNPQHIDIYSASWGPDDNGRALDGPGVLAKAAFVQGIMKGRGGKGNIFVWASGNGGNADDSCACDGYANSIFTLSISSTSQKGVKPWYLEECASTIATTYSSGEPAGDKQIVTTDLHHLCTERHTGTSASAPMAAGMVALALQANPQLTWRDVQHIVAETATPDPLTDALWVTNGVGRKFSTRYGYGLMDGLAMVKLAEKWKQVPEQKICMGHLDSKARDLVGQSALVIDASVDACSGSGDYVRYLEHVQAQISLDYSRRGDITIYLTSPSGTRSQLIPRRSHDRERGDFKEWPFMSVQFWGEQAAGKWKLEVVNTGSEINRGIFTLWRLIFYGTELAPESSHLPRKDAHEHFPSRQEVSIANRTVVTCHPECDPSGSCSGPSAADCERCLHYITSNGVCVAACLPQFFRDEATRTCVVCSPHCTRCSSPTQCAQCQIGTLLAPNQSLCLHECPTGFCEDETQAVCEKCSGRCPQGFYDKWIWGCAPCHESCRSCNDAGASNCLECRSGLIRNEIRLCIPPPSKCAQNEFELGNHKCTRCNLSCRTCTGQSEHDCTSCTDDRFFLNGTCVIECPKHYAPLESPDLADASRRHRQCVYCFDSTCGQLIVVNDPHPANMTLFAVATVVVVLIAIFLYRRSKRRPSNTALLNGKQYSRLPNSSSGNNSWSQGAVNVDQSSTSSPTTGSVRGPSNMSSDSDVVEFDTMPELAGRSHRQQRNNVNT